MKKSRYQTPHCHITEITAGNALLIASLPASDATTTHQGAKGYTFTDFDEEEDPEEDPNQLWSAKYRYNVWEK